MAFLRYVVRKWVRRFEKEGDEEIKTGHEGHNSFPGKPLMIFERNFTSQKEDIRKETISLVSILYAIFWIDMALKGKKANESVLSSSLVWEVDEPFSLAQLSIKDILDKRT